MPSGSSTRTADVRSSALPAAAGEETAVHRSARNCAVDRHVDERMGGPERGRNPEHERDVGGDGQHDLKTRCDGTGHAELHAVCETASLPTDNGPGSCDGVGAVASGGSGQAEGGARRRYGVDSGEGGRAGARITGAMTHAIDVTSTASTVAITPTADVTRMIASSWSALSVKPGIHVSSGGLAYAMGTRQLMTRRVKTAQRRLTVIASE